jgi:drug/metabolite transporter (DMT)-like permease
MLARFPPILTAVIASLLGGSSFVASRIIVAEGDPTAIAFLRYAGTGALIALAAYATTRRMPRVTRADLMPTLALGVLMFACFGWLFTAATAYIPAARAALIVAAMPVAALALAWALGRERMTWTKALACALAAVGVAVALGDKATGGPEAWKGDAFMILAALIGGAHTVLSAGYVRRYTALPLIAVQSLAGAAALGVALAASGDFSGLSGYSPGGWTSLVWLVVPGGFMSYLLWFHALGRLPASRVALCVTLNPLAAALGGALILDESVGARLLIGFVFVASAIALASRARAER